MEPEDIVLFFAGSRYREFLEETLMRFGVHVNVRTPLEGRRIGEQLQWLKGMKRIGKLANRTVPL